eukprot:m51a1_g8812 putative sphingosine-1-phosphate lyase (518) ;mRNA; r:295549-297860
MELLVFVLTVVVVWVVARLCPPLSALRGRRQGVHAAAPAASSGGEAAARMEAQRSALAQSIASDLSRLRIDGGLSYTEIPAEGVAPDTVREFLRRSYEAELRQYREKKISGTVYTHNPECEQVIKEAVGMFCSSNPLHFDTFFCTRRMEAETIRMVAHMLHGGDKVCGAITTGGTESIIMSMKAYRDRAVAQGRNPDDLVVLATETAHSAWLKGARMLRVRMQRVPMTPTMEMDVDKLVSLITPDTMMVVASAPAYPHGVIDPIEKIAAVCDAHGVGLHVDACLGGFVLAWAARAGFAVPAFDFAVRGVTSVSCDTHKYGYGPKGTSVLLFESKDLRRHMFFTDPDWPGGLYGSPSMPGSRAGAQIVGAWASLVLRGSSGFLRSATAIMRTARAMIDGIQRNPAVRMMGDPAKATFVVAFTTVGIDVYQFAEALGQMGWDLNCMQFPSCVHLVVTEGHVGCEDEFVQKVNKAIELVSAEPSKFNKRAPLYSAGANIPDRSFVGALLTDMISAACDAL